MQINKLFIYLLWLEPGVSSGRQKSITNPKMYIHFLISFLSCIISVDLNI